MTSTKDMEDIQIYQDDAGLWYGSIRVGSKYFFDGYGSDDWSLVSDELYMFTVRETQKPMFSFSDEPKKNRKERRKSK